MYSQGEIEDAVTAGALDPGQAASLRAFVAARNKTPTADEEYWWLTRGFNDYFVYVVSVALLVGVGWLGTKIPIGSDGGMRAGSPIPLMAALFVAAASWGLAEIFALRRRMALPGFLYALTFGLGVNMVAASIFSPMASGQVSIALIAAVCGVIAAAATWGFWLRFKIPFAVAFAVGLAAGAIMSIFTALLGGAQSSQTVINIIGLLLGATILAYAMWWDRKDPWRVTQQSDVALWLHLIAAVMIVIPLSSLLGLSGGVTSVTTAILMIVLFLIVAFVSLAINRKALLLVGAFPLVISFANLFQRGGSNRYPSEYDTMSDGGFGGPYGGSPYGPSPSYGGGTASIDGTFITLLIVSLIMLAMAFWWTPLRRIVSGILPESIRARAPMVEAAPQDYAPPPPPTAPPPPQPPVV